MKFSKTSIEKLKKILEKDYKISLNDNEIAELGKSLLIITSLVLDKKKKASTIYKQEKK
jgi:hypothetical protein